MEIFKLLKESFLFRGLDDETMRAILSAHSGEMKCFKRGDLVYSSKSGEKLVGFVIRGRCEVRLDHSDGSKTLLNSIAEGGSFGILSIYSDGEFPTRIYAERNCEVYFFNADQIGYFVNNYSQISLNLINFLAERISFLNKKIATFSGTRVEDRLAAYLLCEREKAGCDTFPFNRQRASEEINAGRASVYRAIASLEEMGLILLCEKQIQIIDRLGLERKQK